MTEAYIRAIYALMFELVSNSGGRTKALAIEARLIKEIQEYEARQYQLGDTDTGRSAGGERDTSEASIRRSVGSGTGPNAKRGGDLGI